MSELHPLDTEFKAPETLPKESYLLVFSLGSQTFGNLYGRQSGLKTVIIPLGFKSNQCSSQCSGEPEHTAQLCPQEHNRQEEALISYFTLSVTE